MIGKGHTRIRKSMNQVTSVHFLVLLLGLLVMALAKEINPSHCRGLSYSCKGLIHTHFHQRARNMREALSGPGL